MAARPSVDAYYLEMAAVAAKRSTCPRRAVGAILVDARHVILGVGHNGVPRGIPHCGEFFEDSTKPSGYDLEQPVCAGMHDARGNTRRCWAVHAEVNAILQCADIERARTLYCSATPCFACAKVIANTGITRVVYAEVYHEPSPSGLDVLLARGIACVCGSIEIR